MPRMPSLCSSCPTVNPGVPFSIRNAVSFSVVRPRHRALREHGKEVRDARVRDPHLLAVQRVSRPIRREHRPRPRIHRIRARGRLRQRIRPDKLARRQSSAGTSASAPASRTRRSAASQCPHAPRTSRRSCPAWRCSPRQWPRSPCPSPGRRTPREYPPQSAQARSPRFISRRVTAKSFASIASLAGTTSLIAKSRVVCAICLCSSVKSSGKKQSAGVASVIRKLPPGMRLVWSKWCSHCCHGVTSC